jgi:hypothetical protein
MRILLSLEGPISIASQIGGLVAAASFQQQHGDVRIFSQPARATTEPEDPDPKTMKS